MHLAVRGHDVPARAARGERVRRDHRDVVAEQVVPVLDVLRVAPADGERDDRRLRAAAVLALVPVVLGDEAGVDQTGHVGLDREVDEVGRLHRPRPRGTGRPRSRTSRRARPRSRRPPGSRAEGLLVDLLRGRVGDEADLAADVAAATRRRRVESSEPQAATTPRARTAEADTTAATRASRTLVDVEMHLDLFDCFGEQRRGTVAAPAAVCLVHPVKKVAERSAEDVTGSGFRADGGQGRSVSQASASDWST